MPDEIQKVKQHNKQEISTPTSEQQCNGRSLTDRHQFKEYVEIPYKMPVKMEATTNTRTEKPLVPLCHISNHTEHEKTYQPLIPPKTYKGPQETSAYQDLNFETREPERNVVNNSEGQYNVVEQKEKVNAYEPISFGGGGNKERPYQPLTFRREELNIYEHPRAIPT